MTKLAPEWVRTSDPVIRSPARYRWTMAPAYNDRRAITASGHDYALDHSAIGAGMLEQCGQRERKRRNAPFHQHGFVAKLYCGPQVQVHTRHINPVRSLVETGESFLLLK